MDKAVRRTVDGVISVTSSTVISDGWLNIQSRPIANALLATPVGTYHLAAKDTSGDTKAMRYIADFVTIDIGKVVPRNVNSVCRDGTCKGAFVFIEEKFPWTRCFICPTHSRFLAAHRVLPFCPIWCTCLSKYAKPTGRRQI